ncbi:hypothetical protein BG53_03990, partial [Paenibacillus darwinianus]
MKILITGAAGFIGFHTAIRLLEEGHQVVGADNFNDYYEVRLKEDRAAQLLGYERFELARCHLEDLAAIEELFAAHTFDRVIHLAAQTGVRYSLQNPHAYVVSNVAGFTNILEACRHQKTPHLIYASSSSVYGANAKMPFSEGDAVNHPVSLYAATKKANELFAHTYSHLYGLPTTGLRFFTVYGPWGRPDMAYFSFTRQMMAGEKIQVFNHGEMRRDFTYIDDIVEGIRRLMDHIPQGEPSWDRLHPDPATSCAPYRVYNIGNNRPVELMHFIRSLEEAIGRKAEIELLPMQDGDVAETFADIDALQAAVG